MTLSSMELVALIFLIAIVYVTISTMRMILTMKGYRYGAAGIAVIEVMINITALSLVLNNLDEIQNLLTYVIGFGTGIVIGMKIEDRLMLGYTTTSIVTEKNTEVLAGKLRELGYGVTDWSANGITGERRTMQVFTSKKMEFALHNVIKELDPKAFIVSLETKTVNGGFWHQKTRK